MNTVVELQLMLAARNSEHILVKQMLAEKKDALDNSVNTATEQQLMMAARNSEHSLLKQTLAEKEDALVKSVSSVVEQQLMLAALESEHSLLKQTLAETEEKGQAAIAELQEALAHKSTAVEAAEVTRRTADEIRIESEAFVEVDCCLCTYPIANISSITRSRTVRSRTLQ